MRQHKNIHTGAGLHTCRYCGRDFTHKHVWEVSTLNTNTHSDIILRQLREICRVLTLQELGYEELCTISSFKTLI